MKFWIGVTDSNWFRFLSERQPDEVNFWRPGGKSQFSVLEPGGLFLFKLKSPYNRIAGGGFFVRYSILPLSLAWQAFGEKNGAPNQEILFRMISELRRDNAPNPMIGCTILAEPFFFPEGDWIPAPPDWSHNIVQGKTYDSESFIGRRIWDEVIERLHVSRGLPRSLGVAGTQEALAQYGTEYLTKARLGQGTFRILVTESYNRRCAITGEKTLPVLEAAHIKPFAQSGPNRIDNGLLLRSDLHILFDRGYLTVTEDLQVEVSRRIKDEFENGREYYAMHGKHLQVVPSRIVEQPSKKFIGWHNENIYLP